jgi:hypothetical protein
MNTALPTWYNTPAQVEGRSSGALFEMAYQDRPLNDTRVLDPLSTIAIAPSTIRRPVVLDVPPVEAGDHGPMPDHWHVLDSLRLNAPDRPKLLINGDLDRDQLSLIDAGDGWRAHSLGLHAGAVAGEMVASLKRGRVYQLRHVGSYPYCAVALRGDAGANTPQQGRCVT